MIVTGLVLAGLAALLHVYIFWLESFAWTGPAARKVFGMSEADAKTMQPLAYNQGFYNLFLALAVAVGIVFFAARQPVIGATLVFTGAGSMALAALVLALSSPQNLGSALKQGVLPALAVIALAIGLAL